VILSNQDARIPAIRGKIRKLLAGRVNRVGAAPIRRRWLKRGNTLDAEVTGTVLLDGAALPSGVRFYRDVLGPAA
jgi:hypothetical protein